MSIGLAQPKSLGVCAADRFSEMSGQACAKPCSRAISHRLAMLGAEWTYRLLLTPWRRSSVAAVMAAARRHAGQVALARGAQPHPMGAALEQPHAQL
jgi:hypothetical protein